MAKVTNGAVSVVAAVAAVEAAQAELTAARETALADLKNRLSENVAAGKALMAEIKALGGKARGGARRASTGTRASNEKSLAVVIAEVLRDAKGPLTLTEIREAVNKAGWKTDSDNYSTLVSQALSTLGRSRVGNKPVAVNTERGIWESGSATAIKAYIADPSSVTMVDANGKTIKAS